MNTFLFTYEISHFCPRKCYYVTKYGKTSISAEKQIEAFNKGINELIANFKIKRITASIEEIDSIS